MDKDQLRMFSVRQKELASIMQEVSQLVHDLDMGNGAQQLEQLKQKIASDSFKVMIMGNFKNGKSTFINAILGQEILPAYATPTTAIINEVKYGKTPSSCAGYYSGKSPSLAASEDREFRLLTETGKRLVLEAREKWGKDWLNRIPLDIVGNSETIGAEVSF